MKLKRFFLQSITKLNILMSTSLSDICFCDPCFMKNFILIFDRRLLLNTHRMCKIQQLYRIHFAITEEEIITTHISDFEDYLYR